jgi:hypothetical protein
MTAGTSGRVFGEGLQWSPGRCDGPVWKAEDITVGCDHPSRAEHVRHRPVLADLVLAILGEHQIVLIERLLPDEN